MLFFKRDIFNGFSQYLRIPSAFISCFNSCLTAVPAWAYSIKLKLGTQFNYMTEIKI